MLPEITFFTPEEMINLIEKSKDNEKEKKAAIKLLRKKEMHYGR